MVSNKFIIESKIRMRKYLAKKKQMKVFLLVLSLLFISLQESNAAISIASPYKNQDYNYKGNLHAHTNNSDGTSTPTIVGEWYRDNFYDFYAITDHNYLTPDPGVAGILFIGSSEEDSENGNTGHSNKINITSAITTGTAQERISNAHDQGGVVILNHIDRPDKLWSAETILSLSDILALEIFNGSNALTSTGTWDTVLTANRKIWGSASDDSHSIGQRGNGYIVVNSDLASPTEPEMLSEMNDGNFYASKGFSLAITVADNTINVSTPDGNKIRWIKKNGAIIKITTGASDSYTVTGYEKYIRAEILDSSDNVKAWSQPLMITGPVHRFYNIISDSHFYTSNQAEATYINDSLYNTYRYEGISNYAYSTNESNTIPVHRFYNRNNGSHFYTSNQNEATYVNDNLYSIYRYEGIDQYVYSTQVMGTVPIHRFYNLVNGSHFFTSNQAEATHLNDTLYSTYRYEGIGCYSNSPE